MAISIIPISNGVLADSLKSGSDKINANFQNIHDNAVAVDQLINLINQAAQQISASKIQGIPNDPVSASAANIDSPLTVQMAQPRVDLIDTGALGVSARIVTAAGVLTVGRISGTGLILAPIININLGTGGIDLRASAVTNSASKIVERSLYWGDETEKNTTQPLLPYATDAGSGLLLKQGRITRSSAHGFNFSIIHVIAEISTLDPSSPAVLNIVIGGNMMNVGQTTNGGYTVVQNSFNIANNGAFADPSINLLEIFLHATNPAVTASLRTLEIYTE